MFTPHVCPLSPSVSQTLCLLVRCSLNSFLLEMLRPLGLHLPLVTGSLSMRDICLIHFLTWFQVLWQILHRILNRFCDRFVTYDVTVMWNVDIGLLCCCIIARYVVDVWWICGCYLVALRLLVVAIWLECSFTWLHLIEVAFGCTGLIWVELDCIWLHMVVLGYNWLDLVALGCTLLLLVSLGCKILLQLI